MQIDELISAFTTGLHNTSALEYVAVVSGIVSVWFSSRTSVWVYPTGLLNTIIYIYLSFDASLYGEASVNGYYTIMSLYGWWIWSKRDEAHQPILSVSWSSPRFWGMQLLFFSAVYAILLWLLQYLRNSFAADTIPWADALASASAYTGMWLMTRKKVESWYWWIITNLTAAPLYFIKGYVVTSLYYLILLAMAFAGLASWMRKASKR